MTCSLAVLERSTSLERMVPVDPLDPPALSAGARLIGLRVDGSIDPTWQWADAFEWRDAFAIKTIAGACELEACPNCGLIAVEVLSGLELCSACIEQVDS